MDQSRPASAIDFATETADVDVNEIGARLVVVIPDVDGQRAAADDFAGMTRKKLEERVFTRRQYDPLSTATYFLPARIYFEVGNRNGVANHPDIPTKQRSQACEQLLELERLYEVVVRTGVQSIDAIFDRVFGGENQYRSVYSATPELLTQRDTVSPRHHHIDDEGRVRMNCRVRKRLFAVADVVDGKRALPQPSRKREPELFVVLSEQKTHEMARLSAVCSQRRDANANRS